MKKYKLITQDRKTRKGLPNETDWPIGKWNKATGSGGLCSDGMLHCYDDPYLALFLNPIHANIENPIVCEVETRGRSMNDRGLKRGYKEMRVARDLDISEPTTEQRVEFAIRCSMEVYKSDSFTRWAEGWLSGRDRSTDAARSAADAAWAAARFADAATWAAAAAWAADAAWYADAARAAARAADATWAADAARSANAVTWAADAATDATWAADAIDLVGIARRVMGV